MTDSNRDDQGTDPQEVGNTPEPAEQFADAAAGVNPDLTAAVGAEDLDSDRLDADPLEEGMDPPEHPVAADRHGVTGREQAEGQSVEDYLAAERPDFGDEQDPADNGDTATSGVRGPDQEHGQEPHRPSAASTGTVASSGLAEPDPDARTPSDEVDPASTGVGDDDPDERTS